MNQTKECLFYESLTLPTQGHAVIHDVTDERHDDAEQGEEDPVFSDLGERVLPDERRDAVDAACPFPAVRVHQLPAPLLLFLTGLLVFTHLRGPPTREFRQRSRVPAIHLFNIHAISSVFH